MYILYTPLKTNMDTQNDGLEKVTPFENGNFLIFLVSMLDFRGVYTYKHAHDILYTSFFKARRFC